MSDYLGVAREAVYSPGKVEDDRAILDAVAAALRRRHAVRVVSADDPLPRVAAGTMVFAMCQGPAALETLRGWEAGRVRVINSVRAIENCHRVRTIAALADGAVPHPPSVLVPTDGEAPLPAWVAEGAWLKRGDVHAVEAADVVRVGDAAAARAALAGFRGRGITAALIQRHLDGPVVKFYAVRGRYFAWFSDGSAELPPGAEDTMRDLAERGAAALGLEIFGGDCVWDRREGAQLIDLNDWPSYGRCRAAAAEAIAGYLESCGGSQPTDG